MAEQASRAGGPGTAQRSVLSRALSVLAAFDARHPVLSLSDIARRANLPMATAHRHVRELEEWTALRRRDDGTYEIGSRFRRLAALDRLHDELVHAALGPLQDVVVRSGGTAVLLAGEEDGSDPVVVLTVAGTRPVPMVPPVGRRWPLTPAIPNTADATGTTGAPVALRRVAGMPPTFALVAPVGVDRARAMAMLLVPDSARAGPSSQHFADAVAQVSRRLTSGLDRV